MKKIIIAILIGSAFIFTGCGNSEVKNNDTTLKDVADSKTTEEANEKLEEIKEQQKDDKCDIKLADTDNVTITCKGKGKSAFGGIYITLEVVNKTDKDIMVGVDKCSNDGTMVNPLYGKTITAGMKAESDISVLDKNLTEVKNFQGTFNVWEDDNPTLIESIDFKID